ncbi:MAG: tyrosine-type recombinase/integrase [Agathobacter rectalis]
MLTDDEMKNKSIAKHRDTVIARQSYYESFIAYGHKRCRYHQSKVAIRQLNEDVIRLVQSKTRTELELPLRPNVGNAIYDYIIEERPACSYDTVFISEAVPHEPLKVQTIRWLVRKVFKLANIRMGKGERIGTHLFRHNLTRKLLEKDTALPVISNILGHTSPKSVDPYLHTDFPHLKECALSIENFPIRREVFDID